MKKSIQEQVMAYESKESQQGEKLQAGVHEVHLSAWKVTHSRVKWDGDEKPNLPEFDDPTPQLGIEFRNADGDVGWHRFNMTGFARWEDLTDKQQADDKHVKVIFGEQVYACKQTANGLVRIQDVKRTNAAHSFVDQFFAAMNQTGQTIGVGMARMLDSKEKFSVTLKNDPYGDNDHNVKVKSFNRQKVAIDDFG
ncbi:hypothetical protein DRO66_07500 [Candidatus Bathyarchaeota archaeon]|nr:MAG: hypothetical protein DRO66_07500 [Candidatus Bathyarchaeota archaeon]